MEDSSGSFFASATGGATAAAPTPINKAHSYAAAAEDYTEQHKWPWAIDAHFRAAEQFMLAVNFASDPEAIRTLKLLYANHTRQGKELQRRTAASSPRGGTPGKDKRFASELPQPSSSLSSQPDAPPAPEAQRASPPSSLSTRYHRPRPSSHSAGSPIQYVPPDSAADGSERSSTTPSAAVAAGAAATTAQPDASRALGHPPFARHRSPGLSPSATSPAPSHMKYLPQNRPATDASHDVHLSPRQMEGQPQYYPSQGLRSEEGLEFESYTRNGLPNTGHAILPVQSLDASVMQPSNVAATGKPIDDSYMVLKDKDDDGDDADPFNKFWEVVEGLMQKLSNPVAFATAPLGGLSGLGDTQPASQYYPEHTFLPARRLVQPSASSSFAFVRGGIDLNPPNTARGDVTTAHSSGMPVQDLSHAGFGKPTSGRRDVAESAYFIVPGGGGGPAPTRRHGSTTRPDSPDMKRHSISGIPFERARPGTGDNSLQLGPGLVNTSQIISPRGLPRSGSKSLEEYAIENQQLKMTVDFLSQRVAFLERAAEENTMLKSSLHQFRQEVSRHAKRIMQSQEIMRSSVLSSARPSRADNSTSIAHNSRLQSRIQELEEEVRVARQEAEKNSHMAAKYRGKWEKIKEAARKKRHNSGVPPQGPSAGSVDGAELSTTPLPDAPPDDENEDRERRQSEDRAGGANDAGMVDTPSREEGGADPVKDVPLEGLNLVHEVDDRGEEERAESTPPKRQGEHSATS